MEQQANDNSDIQQYLISGYLDAVISGSELKNEVAIFLYKYFSQKLKRDYPKMILNI